MLAPLRAPIEKLFDAGTLSNYDANSKSHYFPSTQGPLSDLPLRNHDRRGSLSRDAVWDETLKPSAALGEIAGIDDDTKRRTQDWTFASSLPMPVNAVEGLDEVGGEANRRTKDWTFASSLPAAPDASKGLDELSDNSSKFVDTTSFPRQLNEAQRQSMAESLIDLDMSASPTSPSPQRQRLSPSRVSVT
ncbi:hypothetical protein V491_08479, partial [Pseudogymnoascus sp. VKM F-3775]